MSVMTDSVDLTLEDSPRGHSSRPERGSREERRQRKIEARRRGGSNSAQECVIDLTEASTSNPASPMGGKGGGPRAGKSKCTDKRLVFGLSSPERACQVGVGGAKRCASNPCEFDGIGLLKDEVKTEVSGSSSGAPSSRAWIEETTGKQRILHGVHGEACGSGWRVNGATRSCATARRRPADAPEDSCRGCGSMDIGTRIHAHCGHNWCGQCLRDAVGVPAGEGAGASAGSMEVKGCSDCGEAFSEADMLHCMSRSEVDGVMDRLLLAFLDKNPDVIHCPGPGCKTRIMRNSEAKRDGKLEMVAPDGQQLTMRHAKHMAANRMRCPDCATNFCAACMTVPYHVALTCEQERVRQEARPCRFCSAPLPPGAKAGSTCGAADCKTALASVCEVRHMSCKHWCMGVFGESQCLPCLQCSEVADDFCNICWTDALRASPVIQLKCKHCETITPPMALSCLCGVSSKGYAA